jgi:hypothetical protein
VSTLKFNKWQSVDGVTRNAVLQVVSETISTQASTTSASFVDSPITASITPTSATSKILISATVFCRIFKASSTFAFGALAIYRGSTVLYNPNYTDATGPRGAVWQKSSTTQSNDFFSWPLQFVDSPNTTSEVTYMIKYAAPLSEMTINITTAGYPETQSTITLMEIAQ